MLFDFIRRLIYPSGTQLVASALAQFEATIRKLNLAIEVDIQELEATEAKVDELEKKMDALTLNIHKAQELATKFQGMITFDE